MGPKTVENGVHFDWSLLGQIGAQMESRSIRTACPRSERLLEGHEIDTMGDVPEHDGVGLGHEVDEVVEVHRTIGAKPPLVYLKDRIDNAHLGETDVRYRLESHLIPWDEFTSQGEDVAAAYDAFLNARASLIATDLAQLCDGAEPGISSEVHGT